MKRLGLGLFLTVLTVVGVVSSAFADDRRDNFRADLSGYNEVHFVAGNAAATPPVPPALRGAVSTVASGKFKARIDDANQTIHYELSYKDLEGIVTQAHIHFGQPHTAGGIVIWLCATPNPPNPGPNPPNPGNTPAPPEVADLTPDCPQEGTVEGTITSAQLLSQVAQGIDVGPPVVTQAVRDAEFAELIRAIRAGATYANVHSVKFGPGEIRGQIRGGVLGKLFEFLDRNDD